MRKDHGMAIPAALIMLLLITSLTAILTQLSVHGFRSSNIIGATEDTYLAAEGAMNKQLSELSVYALLWEQTPRLAVQPDDYVEYSPATFSSSNGIPSCSGIACHRHMYPTGGGLVKNLGPFNDEGAEVDSSYPITEQLDPEDPPEPDLELGNSRVWTQVERLEESTPNASMVGGSLSNALAEGGNAKTVRFRITAVSTKEVRGRRGYATVVTVVEMPLS